MILPFNGCMGSQQQMYCFFTTTAKGLPDYVVHRSLSMVDGMNEIRVKTFIKHTS